ncbi:MAG: M15 family metallopeptidase [Blautia sp.]|nr:M15 family metallopeptidase [Blautia sp.]
MSKKEKMWISIIIGVLSILAIAGAVVLLLLSPGIKKSADEAMQSEAANIQAVETAKELLTEKEERIQIMSDALQEKKEAEEIARKAEEEEKAKKISEIEADEIYQLEAGTTISAERLQLPSEEPDAGQEEQEIADAKEPIEKYFRSFEIPEDSSVYKRIYNKSFRPENSPVSLSELRYLKVLHYNFSGEIQVGELVVNERLADDFLAVFRNLFDKKYQINSIRLIESYWKEEMSFDEAEKASLRADNSFALHYKNNIEGTELSSHASGTAVDINPLENPLVRDTEDGNESAGIEESQPYVNRDLSTNEAPGKDYMIEEDGSCVQIFREYGFSWGGSYKAYAHFNKEI